MVLSPIDYLNCPISQDVLENVVQTSCKHNYSFETLNIWLNSNDTCPLCRDVLHKTQIVFHRALQAEADKWKADENNYILPDNIEEISKNHASNEKVYPNVIERPRRRLVPQSRFNIPDDSVPPFDMESVLRPMDTMRAMNERASQARRMVIPSLMQLQSSASPPRSAPVNSSRGNANQREQRSIDHDPTLSSYEHLWFTTRMHQQNEPPRVDSPRVRDFSHISWNTSREHNTIPMEHHEDETAGYGSESIDGCQGLLAGVAILSICYFSVWITLLAVIQLAEWYFGSLS